MLRIALILISILAILRHAANWAGVLREGIATSPVAMDFRIYLCGASHIDGPYDRCTLAGDPMAFIYPPPSLIYFSALSKLSPDMAFVVHGLVSLVALAAAAWMLWRLVPGSPVDRATALVASLAIAPIGTSFAVGQVNMILLFTCVAPVYLAVRHRPILSGLATAIGFWLKLYPILVLLLFLKRDRWPSAWAAGLWIVVLAGLSLICVRTELFAQYFMVVMPHIQGLTMPGVAQSVTSIWTHAAMGGEGAYYHFYPVAGLPLMVGRLIMVAAIGAAFWLQRLTNGERPVEVLAILLVGALLSAPNSWAYLYVLVVPALFVAMLRGLERPSAALAIVLICWVLLMVPGWTEPPRSIGSVPWLNVLFRGRYVFAAAALCLLVLFGTLRADDRRSV